MSKKHLWSILVTSLFATLILSACGAEDENSRDDDDERDSCAQATDCGEGGRSAWVCRDGMCYTVEEFCFSDEECNGDCVNHVCEDGKINDDISDGDSSSIPDGDQEEEQGQVPCEFECCTNADCYVPDLPMYCDLNTNSCIQVIECDKECCQDFDCQSDPSFGENFICQFNKCVDPEAPCQYECCSNADCIAILGEDAYCIMTEGPEQGTCRTNVFSCTAGEQICCYADPGNPLCLELDDLKTEAILTCNVAGDAYELTMCAEFNDCTPNGDGTVSCWPNGRCETNDHCDCPKLCTDTPNGKKCMVPVAAENEVCFDDSCNPGGEAGMIASCEGELICCVDQNTNVGTCVVTCGK